MIRTVRSSRDARRCVVEVEPTVARRDSRGPADGENPRHLRISRGVRRWSVAVLPVVLVTSVGGCTEGVALFDRPAVPAGTYQLWAAGDLDEMLSTVSVVRDRPQVPGYDRACGSDNGCVFGPAWSDDVAVEGGRNGCDTRNDILARDLTAVEFRSSTRDCVVVAGALADPYTGEKIAFRKAEAHEVGVDHVVPLARAWDLGAASWTTDRRRDFANDPVNLLAVSGSANSSKRDQGPGEWLPTNAAYRCAYIARYLEVSIVYSLPVTRSDHDAATVLAPSCTGAPRE